MQSMLFLNIITFTKQQMGIDTNESAGNEQHSMAHNHTKDGPDSMDCHRIIQ